MTLTDCFKKRICCLISNPKKGITYAWLVSLLLVFIAFIVACVSAAKMQEMPGGGGHAAGFAAVWTALLLVVLSVMGTVIMRRFQTPLAIGYFLGVVFIMCQQMLILFALFVERSQHSGQTAGEVSSQKAMATFSYFLFLIYAGFGLMLTVFRDDVIKTEVLTEDPDMQDNHTSAMTPEYK